jgi:hypothetical protein
MSHHSHLASHDLPEFLEDPFPQATGVNLSWVRGDEAYTQLVFIAFNSDLWRRITPSVIPYFTGEFFLTPSNIALILRPTSLNQYSPSLKEVASAFSLPRSHEGMPQSNR